MANANQFWIGLAVKTGAPDTFQCNRAGLYNIVGVGLCLDEGLCVKFMDKLMFVCRAIKVLVGVYFKRPVNLE